MCTSGWLLNSGALKPLMHLMHTRRLRAVVCTHAPITFSVQHGLPVRAQGDWGTQFGMLIQHLDDSREGGLAGGGADEDVKDLQVPSRIGAPPCMGLHCQP